MTSNVCARRPIQFAHNSINIWRPISLFTKWSKAPYEIFYASPKARSITRPLIKSIIYCYTAIRKNGKQRERERARNGRTYMRGEEVGNEIKGEAPPDGAEYVACDLSHSLHQEKAVVNLGNELEQENQFKCCHYHLYSFFSY